VVQILINFQLLSGYYSVNILIKWWRKWIKALWSVW